MHRSWVLTCLTVLFAALMLPACHSSAPVIEPGGDSADPLARGLPGLSGLGQPQRSLSLKGPGYVLLEQRALVSRAHLTLDAEPKVTLDGFAGMAYGLYGVYGFDGDNGPTSARITADAASGQLYVAFSDYEHGHWVFSGAFTMPAGGGTLEAEIPNSGDYVSPNSFIGPAYHATYLAVVVPEGGSLTGAVVELGVHGGMRGPQPSSGIYAQGGATGMLVRWIPSVSSLDPDFAGYFIERAPFLAGTYAPLNPAPVLGDTLDDTTAALGQVYRYRVAAVDASGNRSVWTTGLGIRKTGLHEPPVADVNLENGTLFGPVTLNIDMSASHDPEGGTIDTYEIVDAGTTLYSGAGFVLNMTFQPGCHALTFAVKVGTRVGSTLRLLKVYPRWRDGASLVASSPPQVIAPRMTFVNAARDPASGTAWFCGFDLWANGYVVRATPPGGDMAPMRMPVYKPILFSGEPVLLNGEPQIPLSFADSIKSLAVSGNQLHWTTLATFTTTQTNDRVAFASDGGDKLWSVYSSLDGTFKLTAISWGDVTGNVVIDPLPAIIALDAVYNPNLDVVEVAYSTVASTEWLRLNASTLAIVDSAQISAISSPGLDIEYNPATHEPAVAYGSGLFVRYREHTGAGWSAEDHPDPSGGNSNTMDLAFLGNEPRILMSDIGAQTSVYQPSGANWVKRNVLYTANSGLAARLLPFDDGGDAYLVADVGVDRHVYFAMLNPDGTETMILDRWPTCGQGMQMHGAGGSDGLHVVWRDLIGSARHVIGSPDGLSWVDGPAMGTPSHLDLVSLADGTVYLSSSAAGWANLTRWNGAAFAPVATQLSAIDYRPFLAHGMPSSIVSWCAYLDAAGILYALQGNQGSGYTNASAGVAGLPVYSGVGLIEDDSQPAGSSTNYLTLHSGAAYADSVAGLYYGIGGGINPVCTFGSTDNYMHAAYVTGRNLAAAQFIKVDGTGDVYYLSNGSSDAAWRYIPDSGGGADKTELLSGITDPQTDLRRTVSAATTAEVTAVALICDFGGREPYMEWSNFGNWEQLPLPGPDMNYGSDARMSKPQLFIGHDGRWHIVYHDWDTDTIYIRSTL